MEGLGAILVIRTRRVHLGSHRLHQADWALASTRMINNPSAIPLRLLRPLMIQAVTMMMEMQAWIWKIGDSIGELAD